MSVDFFDPTPEQQVIVLVESATLRRAEQLIQSCEHCNDEGAQIPFDNILDRVTGSDPSVTDYILEEPTKCPPCRRDILEKTLIVLFLSGDRYGMDLQMRSRPSILPTTLGLVKSNTQL
jgi:hypothetical protein